MSRFSRRRAAVRSAMFGCILIAGCGGAKKPPVEDLRTHEDLSLFTLGTMRGQRDGDRLQVEAMYSDSSSMLTLGMRFAIGSPTRLESGTWRWRRNNGAAEGAIAARSVTFLGGQDGPPSIGGVFDLLDAAGARAYRINLPVTELRKRSKRPAS